MNARSIICRLCLVENVQIFNLNNDNLRNCYYNLTGVMDLGMFPYICYECLALLKRFGNFRSKCLTADQILKNVNIHNVKKIDRESIGLTSTLTFTNCISVTTKSMVDRKTNITIDCSDEDEDQKSDLNFDEKLDAHFDEQLGTNFDENIDTNFVEKLDADFNEKLDANFYANFDDELDANFDNNGDDSELNFYEDNPNVSATAAILEDHTSIKNKTEHEVSQTKKSNKPFQNKRKIYFNYLKGVATITLLSPEDARNALDARRLTGKYLKSKFKCHFCNLGYSLKSAFDKHMKIHNPKKSKYECHYCHSRLRSRNWMRKHLEDHHTWKFECNTCSHVCFDLYTAREHANTHNKKSFKCDFCSMIFFCYKTLCYHKRYKHAMNTVPCALCGETFATDFGLKKHVQVMHVMETEEPNGPYCDLCDVRFATDVAWKRHFVLSDKHKDITIGCETCGEVFGTREELREHAREYKHTNNKLHRTRWPYPCIYCTKLLADKDEYESHMKNEHPNTLSKSWCRGGVRGGGGESHGDARNSRGGARVSRGGAHKSRGGAHSGGVAKEKRIHICELCGMQFKWSNFLKIHHQERHTDGSPQFKCKICGKPFQSSRRSYQCASSHASVDERTCGVCGNVLKDKNHLRVHMSRVHSNVRRHKCPMCDKAFSTACEVKYHIGHVHCKVPWPKRNRSQTKKTIED